MISLYIEQIKYGFCGASYDSMNKIAPVTSKIRNSNTSVFKEIQQLESEVELLLVKLLQSINAG